MPSPLCRTPPIALHTLQQWRSYGLSLRLCTRGNACGCRCYANQLQETSKRSPYDAARVTYGGNGGGEKRAFGYRALLLPTMSTALV